MWLRTSWNGSFSARILRHQFLIDFLSIADAAGIAAFSAACISASSLRYSDEP